MDIKSLIKQHEGLSLKPYRCPAGKLTIGYGRNLEDNGIYDKEADMMLANDLVHIKRDLKAVFGWRVEKMSDSREAAFLDMLYNMGLGVFLEFKKMIAAVKADNWEEAAKQALDSEWAKQVGQRAITDAEMIRKG